MRPAGRPGAALRFLCGTFRLTTLCKFNAKG